MENTKQPGIEWLDSATRLIILSEVIQIPNKKILIIDDNEPERNLVKIYLSEEIPEIEITEVNSCVKAMDVISRDKFDLMLLDYSMPSMSGIDFLKESRYMIENTPVVMVTGTGNEEIAAKAFKLGVTDYLVKTADLRVKIVEVVKKILYSENKEKNLISAKLSSVESGKKLVKEYQLELDRRLIQRALKEKMIVEFDTADDFNEFSRWVIGENNINIKDIQIFDNKYVVLVTISPSCYVTIK